ncbi:PREDICTED: mediator of DNA damage checkpoint protein 1 isoform X1 [Poecilia mexicana]|uniref:Mediator of DNA damage checkpoint protein 1 n=1 Tax=Poecilia mexicana TaxID=48701 RepID=A0A3B3WLG9_9TELE|nr:PREDICTED: mediator of DNA damage checkpoint protein 1 isoform X1 [Poecilia mexicana]
MDATQVINDSIFESEEEESEEEIQNERRKPLAKLCILNNPHIPEKELPLFLGDNFLGRDPNLCTLQLLAPSVSKQHAAISISVHRRRGRVHEVDMEALVWDLKSMNGTRKGRLKLTPNVRYALSEGDSLVLGDIPCRYVSSRVDSPSSLGDIETPRQLEANARLSDWDDVDTGSKKCVSSGTKAKRTAVTGGCLSFEKTPVQPQGSLVPESDSDSESEREGRGNRKQKAVVSDSDSHKSSPNNSAFVSPPSKVVPESEDESSITPSSSSRNGSSRRISFSLEKTDVDLEKNKSPVFAENGMEEGEGAAEGGKFSEESGDNVKREGGKSPTGSGESLRSPLRVSRDAVPEFNLDSDTDVEGGEEEEAPAGKSDQRPNTVLSHMDSDTDVDEDVSDKTPRTSSSNDEATKCSPAASGIQLEGITVESDTDMDDDDDDDDANVTSKATLPKGEHSADSAPSVQSEDFHLDSDTDVDEEEEAGKRGNPKIDETLSENSDKPLSPHSLHPDSDACDKEVAATGLDILSESDTDLEEDSLPAVPAAAADLPVSSAAAAAGAPESDSDTDVDEPVAPRAADEGKPADLRMESDTDVEDEEANPGEEEGGRQTENALRQNCSTPVQVSEGEVEQMETQAFTIPTSHPPRYAVPSSLRPALMSSCSDSQEDEDYSVAETQSFILQTRSCHKGLNPNRTAFLESSAVKPEDRSNRDDSFQLGLSDSSHLQGEARENARADAAVDGGVNMEDTQDYEESAENDSNLEATQPYEVEPPRSLSRKETCVDLTMEATQAYIPEPYDEGSDEDEGLNSARTESVAPSALAMAETQPMFSSVEDNEPDCSSEPVKNETERHVADSESVAETQPMFTSDNEESGDEELSAESLKSSEAQKHPRTSSPLCLAETQPVCLSDNEESGDDEELSAESLRPSKVETHPNTDAALPLAETQPPHVGADETEPKDSCGDHENNSEILLPRKRKAKQLHIDEEESQQHTDSGETQPLTPGEDDDDLMPSLRKRKAKPLQLEDETQSLVGSQVSADGSQRSVTCEEEQSSQDFISTRKRKAKPLHIEDEQTQPLISCEDEDILPERETKALPLTAVGVPPAEVQAEGRDGKRDGDESVTYPRKRKEKRLHLKEEETQPVSASESQRKTDETKVSPSTKEAGEQTKTKDDNNQQEVKAVNKNTRGRRTARKQEEQDGDKNKRAENENQIKEQRGGKLRGEPERHKKKEELMNEGTFKPHLEDETKPVTASESQRRIDGTKKESKAAAAGTKETGEQTKNKDESDQQEVKVVNRQTRGRRTTRKQEQDEDKKKSQTKEQRDGKPREDKEETERHKEKEELNNEGTSKSHLEDEMQPVTISEVSPANTLKKNDVFDASSISSSMETRLGEEEEKAQCSSRQNRQTKTENKPLPSTRGRRGKAKSEDDNNQEEVKAANQPSRGRRSTRKQDDDERQRSDENKSHIKEEGDKEEREHVETERRNEKEGKSKGKHRLKETKSGGEVEEEKGTSVETTKMDQEHLARLEKEKQPKESQEDKNEEESPKGSARVRRAARRTTTAACEASSEDVLARRTRSRSNSLSSERSVSSVNSNTPENKGRGRGAKRSSEASQTDTVRSSRRRTTTATAAEPDAEAQAVSASSKVSRGRPQGRGRKTLSQPDVVIKENEQKATEVLQLDEKRKADPRLAGTSRGQRRVTASCSEALVLNDEGLQSNQEKTSADLTSPLPKRNMRDRGGKTVKTEPVEETEAPTATDGDETTNKRKAKTSEEKTEVDRVQKSTEPGGKEEQQEEIPAGIQGRRTSRASSSQVKKNEELPPKQEVKDGKKAAAGPAGKKARGRTTVVQKNKNQELQETQTSGSSMEPPGNEIEPEVSAVTPPRKRRVSSNSSPMAKTPRSSFASPATVSRVRAGSQTYKVLFTGVVDEDGEQVLARLGGAMARGVSDMNCLVTDKVRRTVKFLCAVAKGVPVVTTLWLEQSGKAGSFLSPLAFVVNDPEQEKKFSFSLQESLRTASSQPLLQGYEIHVTKSVKPEPVHMKDIITCSGATFLTKMPAAHKPRTVVISCEEDLRLCGPAVSASLPVVTAEFILTGILQQRVDLQTHALSPSATNPRPAEGRGRGRKKT